MAKLPSLLKHIIPASIVQQKLSVNGCILFTFDDGPDPEVTPRVLDVLDQYGARGLFFIPGCRIERAPKLLKEIIQRKHGIGNHSLNHISNATLSFQELIGEINECKKKIFLLTGNTTEIYRPPMGIIPLSLIVAAKYCKHRIMRWSLDVGEYGHMKNATASELAEHFLKNVHDRAIVLSHDDKDTTPKFLELVLPELIDSGFDLKRGLSLSMVR